MVSAALEGLNHHTDKRSRAVIGRNARKCCLALAMVLIAPLELTTGSNRAVGQEATFAVPSGQPVTLTPEQMKAMRKGGPPGGPPGAQPSPQPGQEAKPEDKDKKKEGEEGKKKEADATVKRPEKPPRVPDPREFKVKLDDKGRVPPFN